MSPRSSGGQFWLYKNLLLLVSWNYKCNGREIPVSSKGDYVSIKCRETIHIVKGLSPEFESYDAYMKTSITIISIWHLHKNKAVRKSIALRKN